MSSTTSAESIAVAELAFGSHYEVFRSAYWHHGIYVGQGEFIHYATHDGDGVGLDEVLGADSSKVKIRCTNVDDFLQNSEPEKVQYEKDNVYPPLKVVARARSKEEVPTFEVEDGTDDDEASEKYNLWANNCEHFARWCTVAKKESLQINFIKNVAKGAVAGALLGRWFGPQGALVGGAIGFFSGVLSSLFPGKRLLPVYEEFVEYASALFFSTKRKHPLGMSFRHSSDKKKWKISTRGMQEDSLILFHYSGSWLFGEKRDWFITERAIVYPHQNTYIDFHDVMRIYSSKGRLTIDTLYGDTVRFPSRFIHARSVAEFLHASVAMEPLFDLKRSKFSVLKEMFHLLIGGILLTVAIGFFFPAAVPWVAGLCCFVVLASPFSFMDKNDSFGASD